MNLKDWNGWTHPGSLADMSPINSALFVSQTIEPASANTSPSIEENGKQCDMTSRQAESKAISMQTHAQFIAKTIFQSITLIFRLFPGALLIQGIGSVVKKLLQ